MEFKLKKNVKLFEIKRNNLVDTKQIKEVNDNLKTKLILFLLTGFRGALVDAVEAGTKRSRQIGD